MLGYGLWQRLFGGDPACSDSRSVSTAPAHHRRRAACSFQGLTGRADVGSGDDAIGGERRPGITPISSWRSAHLGDAPAASGGQVANGQIMPVFGSSGCSASRAAWAPERRARRQASMRSHRSVLLMLAAVASVLLIVCVSTRT
jgi:hypothetical protein